MEERKLTKADIDKVRHIEGFPIAKDEDIIALSRPPYYTACPNPFIEEFIRENGTPYDEATDDYHREPFAADVSEGKYERLYKLHSYPTKVPPKAIMKYVEHYTSPGDIILDCFCGTGMTGVAVQSCDEGDDKSTLKRKAILCDLSPTATYIAGNYNDAEDMDAFFEICEEILSRCEKKYGWLYSIPAYTEGSGIKDLLGDAKGRINYTVYSRVYVCPSCGNKIVLWKETTDYDFSKSIGSVRDTFHCSRCNAELNSNQLEISKVQKYDYVLNQLISVIEEQPVLINYTYAGRRYERFPTEEDLKLINKLDSVKPEEDVPSKRIPFMHQTHQRNNLEALGITHEHHMYSPKSLAVYAFLFGEARKLAPKYQNRFMFLLTSCFNRTTRLVRYMAQHKEKNVGPLSGTLYFPPVWGEINVIDNIKARLGKMRDAYGERPACNMSPNDIIITTQSADSLLVASNSINYVFIDPPFGDNLMYSELNYFTDMWLRIYENNKQEAIINKAQNKDLGRYADLIQSSLRNLYRVLKPNRWITIEFHNSKNAVWNALQEALQIAGFVIADVRTLNKEKGTTKQMVYSSTVKQDLVISAYKPRESFVRQFQQRAGDPEMAWEFVRQHLRNVPVTADGNHDGKLDIISERQDYLLFDRMVAWHIMNGIPVPMDAHTFYEGLRQRFLERDGMFFLPDQVNEYDDKRAHMELDIAQLSFIVTDEKNAIQWLNYILAQGPMTYQDIQPLYMQELHQSRQEKMPELLDMLKENFVQDEKGAWYVPDLTNAADLAKVRRKALLKEFWDSCATGKGKLKVFRMEAIRAGFDECWKTRDFKTIVAVGERLPEAVLQEDPALLMYYDNACSRV